MSNASSRPMRIALGAAVGVLCALPAAAQFYEALGAEFRAAFIASECVSDIGEAMPRCAEASMGMVRYMDRAMLMRTSCPHPLFYPQIVDIAYGCATAARAHVGATGEDLYGCFVDTFNRDYNPASEHYCATLELPQ